MYFCIELSAHSQMQLRKFFHDMVPSSHDWVGHHMTVSFGNEQFPEVTGRYFYMVPRAIGMLEDKVVAVQVETQCPSNNAVKHITLGVNLDAGGKPVMSNKITNWTELPVEKQIGLYGQVIQMN